uniref:Uncharacterized protein n=1 Tax=Spongospora subterranea TaxID=70186 RepID=A0A0H5QJA2_9EUKA|eukprot:CRZ01376.1 hypothetical protein [Spongospora subterranea]
MTGKSMLHSIRPMPFPVSTSDGLRLSMAFCFHAVALIDNHNSDTIFRSPLYRSTALFIAFSVFVLLFTSSYGLVVKFLLGFTLSIAAVATGEQNIAIPDALFSALFCRNADRVDAFMANSILYSLCYWSPYSGFLKCVSVVPYALLMLQDIISVDDVAAFRFFYLALSFVLKLVVIYFSWFSWPWFTFTFALFLPKIFRLVVGFALLVSTVVIWVIDAIITLIPALNKLTSSLIDFAIFPFVAFYTLYFSSRIGLVFSLLLLPSLARTFATAMLSSVVPAVLDVFTPVAVIGFCRVTLAVSFVLTQEVAVRVFHIFRKLRS